MVDSFPRHLKVFQARPGEALRQPWHVNSAIRNMVRHYESLPQEKPLKRPKGCAAFLLSFPGRQGSYRFSH